MADYRQDTNRETQAEYEERQRRIEREIAKFKQQEAIGKRIEKKKNIKTGFVKKVKKFFKVLGISALITSGTLAAYYGVNKVQAIASVSQLTQDEANATIKNDGYKKAKNIEAGYYNSHPLKICISDEFDAFYQFTMRKGLQYLDQKAEGVKFDIVVGDIKTENADVNIVNANSKDYKGTFFEGSCGWTNLLNENATKVSGDIMINTHQFHPMTPAQTVVHESLHLMFGLYHSNNPHSMMYPVCATAFLSQQDIDNINTVLPAEDSSSTYQYDENMNCYVHTFDSSSYDRNLVKELKDEIKAKNNQSTQEINLNI